LKNRDSAKPAQMDAQRPHRADAGFTILGGAAQSGVGGAGATPEGVDGRVAERGVRLHAKEALKIGEAGGALPPRAQEQDQALDLTPRDPPLSRQARDKALQGLAGQGQVVGRQGLAGEAGQIARFILVAGDRAAGLRRRGRRRPG
jgi:hypothetical protein